MFVVILELSAIPVVPLRWFPVDRSYTNQACSFDAFLHGSSIGCTASCHSASGSPSLLKRKVEHARDVFSGAPTKNIH
ncbi:hypothetical protein OPV22_003214 [Ensete ventricosum]|uniref:Secreted protein n=1 Tax=Ensete ventricosum TaxID=4639 RepID=A0AAV8S076_ENSVE|nr:hypothetical protein OPV22_003214 [Ensete ventricosum]